MFFSESNQTIRAVKTATPSVVAVLMSKKLSKVKEEIGVDISRSLEDEKDMIKIGGCSGFFVSADGYILTNRHVVEDEDAFYTVIWQSKIYPSKVLYRDKITDIAILKINDQKTSSEQIKRFPYLKLGNSSQLKLGQTVIAIGNALGEFHNTVSRGIVSGLSRNIKTEIEDDIQEFSGLIQTDAAINPGNSGGPLIDLSGKVVGICTAVVLGVENIGFAIPINQAKSILEDIKKYGKVCRPSLGVRYFLIDEEMQRIHNLPFNYGAFIVYKAFPERSGIIPDSPAEKAGLKEGDIILEIDNKKITKQSNLSQILAQYKIGNVIKVVYWSKGEKKEIEIKLF